MRMLMRQQLSRGMSSASPGGVFFRAGNVSQLRLENAADLKAVVSLDKKKWVALAIPTTAGTKQEQRLLELIDRDHDGSVRAEDIREAVKLALSSFSTEQLDALMSREGSASEMPLDAIDTSTERGQLFRTTAQMIMDSDALETSSASSSSLSLAAMATADARVRESAYNGDGIVEPGNVEHDAALKDVVELIIKCVGSVEGVSGRQGVDAAGVNTFFDACAAHLKVLKERGGDEILPLGDDTRTAYNALEAVRPKVQDYFERCRLAAFAEGGAHDDVMDSLQRITTMREALADSGGSISEVTAAMAELPLSRPSDAGVLALRKGLNPAFDAPMRDFVNVVLKPLHAVDSARFPSSGEQLTQEEFEAVESAFSDYRAWRQKLSSNVTANLSSAQLRKVLEGDARPKLLEFIEADLAEAPRVAAVNEVELLVNLYCLLPRVLRNTVSFSEFYTQRTSMFQAGHLFMDGRRCDLVFEIEGSKLAAHAEHAVKSMMYLAYCTATKKGATRTIVAAFTGGDGDFLWKGRRGVFYSPDGKEWDAVVTRVSQQPISIAEAALLPYKQALASLEAAAAARASKADAESKAAISSPPKKFDVGTVAALGVGVGAITTAVGTFMQMFFGLGYLMPLGVVGVLGFISGPAMFIAALKLRKRNVGPILESSGWAINLNPTVPIALGETLTLRNKPEIPKGRAAKRVLYLIAAGAVAAAAFYYREDIAASVSGLLPEKPEEVKPEEVAEAKKELTDAAPKNKA